MELCGESDNMEGCHTIRVLVLLGGGDITEQRMSGVALSVGDVSSVAFRNFKQPSNGHLAVTIRPIASSLVAWRPSSSQ